MRTLRHSVMTSSVTINARCDMGAGSSITSDVAKDWPFHSLEWRSMVDVLHVLRQVVCRALCVFLVQQITLREGQSLLVVDNGLFLDEFSWGVFEDLIATNNPDSLLERWSVCTRASGLFETGFIFNIYVVLSVSAVSSCPVCFAQPCRRDIYADNVPTVVANAVRAFKGAAAIPVLINVFMRPLHENIDCLSSEVASAAESVRGCSRCRVIQFVSWGGAALKLGSLSKEQSKVVDSGE